VTIEQTSEDDRAHLRGTTGVAPLARGYAALGS